MKEFFIGIFDWFRVKYEMIERMIFWGWNMRHSYDFDALYIYEMLYLKLKRVYECHRNHGHCVWNSSPLNKDMKRLRETYELAKRLHDEGGFFDRNYMNMKNKYRNKSENIFREWDRRLFPEAKEIDSRLYNFFLKRAIEKDSKIRDETQRRFHSLLEKHVDKFWD